MTCAARTPRPPNLAAAGVRRKVTQLHERVIEAYRQHGEMSARQVEALPEFAGMGFSTIRKRVSELASVEMAFLLEAGRKEQETGRTPATVYQLRTEFTR